MLADGDLAITLPIRVALHNALKIIEDSRVDIRKWRSTHQKNRHIFQNDESVGRSHVIKVSYIPETLTTASVRIVGTEIRLYLPINQSLESPEIQKLFVPAVKKALTKQAREHLIPRLQELADQHGFSYSRIRFGTPRGRWGSCSSTGTISLNVNLLLLDDTLIDYVLIHELCHTRQMNHSIAFWSLVEKYLPEYRSLRSKLKNSILSSNP